MLEANNSEDGLGKAGQHHRANKGARYSTWKGEVVVGAGQPVVDVRGWRPIDKHIVSGLDVEGFLDFGIWGK